MRFLILILFTSCSLLNSVTESLPKPEFTLKDIKIKDINLDSINLLVNTNLRNPYPVKLPKSILKTDIFLESLKLTQITTDLGEIPSRETKDFPLDLKLSYKDLYNVITKFPTKELLALSYKGTVSVPVPDSYKSLRQAPFEIPVSGEKAIPAVLPNVEIQNFKVDLPTASSVMSAAGSQGLANTVMDSLQNILGGNRSKKVNLDSLKSVDLNLDTNFDISLKNQAAAKLLFQSLKYDLKLGGENFLSGEPSEILNKGTESIIKISGKLPIKSFSQSLISSFQQKSANFQLQGSSLLNVSNMDESNMPFQFNKSGNFKW